MRLRRNEISLLAVLTASLILAGQDVQPMRALARSVTPYSTTDGESADAVPPVEFVGHIGGAVGAVHVAGNRAYVGIGTELAVLDVSDPARPRRMGSVVLPAEIESVTLDDHYAYVGCLYSCGVRVVDVADPSVPRQVGAFPAAAEDGLSEFTGRVTDLVVDDGLLYAVVWGRDWTWTWARLWILEVSDPTAPAEVAQFLPEQMWDSTAGLAVSDNHVFFTLGTSGLIVVDATDPTTPTTASVVDTEGYAADVAVAGHYAWLVEGGDRDDLSYHPADIEAPTGLKILDIADPSNIVEVGFYALEGRVRTMARNGPYLNVLEMPPHEDDVIAGGHGGVRVLDVSQPTRPVEIRTFQLPPEHLSGGHDLAAHGEYAWLAADHEGMWVLDVARPALPVPVGRYDNAGFRGVEDATAVGDVVLLAAGEDGVRVVSLTDPSHPYEVRHVDVSGSALGMAVDGGHAYVAASSGGLRVLAIDDPSRPVPVGSIEGDDFATVEDVVVQGTVAYLAETPRGGGDERVEGGLRSVDVGNPAQPVDLGKAVREEGYWRLEIHGDRLYTFSRRRVDVWEVAEVAAPRLLGGFQVEEGENVQTIRGGTVTGNGTLVLARGRCWIVFRSLSCEGSLQTVDVSDPAAPANLGRLELYSPYAVDVIDGLALVFGDTHGQTRMRVFDVTTPSEPEQLVTIGNASFGEGRAVSCGEHVLYADPSTGPHGGLSVLRIGASATGHVLDTHGRPMGGVAIDVPGAGRMVTTRIDDGTFVLHRLLQSDGLRLIPRLAGYRFLPDLREVKSGRNAAGLVFTTVPAPVSATLPSPAEGVSTTLRFTDTFRLPTRLTFPSESVSHTTVVTVTPELAGGGRGWTSTGHAFELVASMVGGSGGNADGPSPRFGAPVTVSVAYDSFAARTIKDESALRLFRRQRDGWQLADDFCDQSVTPQHVDVSSNTLGAALCVPGRYAVLGPTRQAYLPLATR